MDIEKYCQVGPDGVAHLFLHLDYGSTCVCGRKTMVLAGEDEDCIFRDVWPWPPAPSPRLIGEVRRPAAPGAGAAALAHAALVLARGEQAIRRARRNQQQTRLLRSRLFGPRHSPRR